MKNINARIRIIAHTFRLFIRYRPWGKRLEPMIVYKIDGLMHHSGLVDRLQQVMGVYARCKYHGYKFGLVADYPFLLEDYLKPNYSWSLKKDEISKNIFYARPLYLGFRSKKEYDMLIHLKNKQLHVYAHIYWEVPFELGFNLKEIFWELFRPSEEILAILEIYREKFKSWNSLHFRFQNLLGDFNEPAHFNGFTLSPSEKQELKLQCYNFVLAESKIHNDYLFVCSDSGSFLKLVSEIPNVFTVPGKTVHIDYITPDESKEEILKSFIDFFLLSKSKKIKSIVSSYLYFSNFPRLAADISGAEFERVELGDFRSSKII